MFVLEAAIFLSGIYASQAAACPVGWHRYGETCYLPITTRVTWRAASQTCIDKQAQLALPRSQIEQDAVWGMFLEKTKGNVAHHIWIGCNDLEEEGKFHPCPLSGDDSGAYENWKDDQPVSNSVGDCAVMIKGAEGRFGDRPSCTGPKYCSLPAPCRLQLHVSVLPLEGH